MPSMKHRRIVRDSTERITKAAIERMMLRAGVKRFSSQTHEESREMIRRVLEGVVSPAEAFLKASGAKTLSVAHLRGGLLVEGRVSLAIPPGALGKYQTVGGLDVKKRDAKARNLQKKTEEVLIPRLAFQRLVREIYQDYSTDQRISSDVFDLLQNYTEARLIRIYHVTLSVAQNAGRKTTRPRDLIVAMKLTSLRVV